VRLQGYYWIKDDGGWKIALFKDGQWWLCGVTQPVFDKALYQIGERIPDYPRQEQNGLTGEINCICNRVKLENRAYCLSFEFLCQKHGKTEFVPTRRG
jgi:hypothetical protein